MQNHQLMQYCETCELAKPDDVVWWELKFSGIWRLTIPDPSTIARIGKYWRKMADNLILKRWVELHSYLNVLKANQSLGGA